MAQSLADLRASKPEPRRPERSITLVLAPDLMAEAQELHAELESVVARPGPKRQGEGEPQRASEIRARLITLYEEMAEYEGELRLRAKVSNGDWRRWCNDHPAREEGEPGYERDIHVARGYCNSDDLLDTLDRFASRWNGDELAESEWVELIEPQAWPGDLNDVARQVVEMYEGGSADFRLRRSALLSNLKRLSDSASPDPSTSRTSDSTDGSPARLSEVSTETVTA